MKRFRIFSFDFDTRVINLTLEIKPEWDETVKVQWENNRKNTIESFKKEFGEYNFKQKYENIIELGEKHFSMIAFHNKFYTQIRNAFIVGSYYSALTGYCALGERILNHLVLNLRDEFKSTKEYKNVYKKNSFDNWDTAIDVLEIWKCILPETANKFREFKTVRNNALHFNPETDKFDRELSIKAIKILDEIVNIQFGMTTQPWLFWVPGEIYIRKEYETDPFVRKIIIPNNGIYVGYQHKITMLSPPYMEYTDEIYEDKEITDEEFKELRKNY